jgi:hypothetical protein
MMGRSLRRTARRLKAAGPPGKEDGYPHQGEPHGAAPAQLEERMKKPWQTLAKVLVLNCLRVVCALCPVCAAGAALIGSSARAQEQPASVQPSAKDKAHARELYTLGQQMFRQGDFAGALKSFQDAYTAVPNPVVLLSIAECQVRAEQYTDALVSLTRYIDERPTAPDRAQVEAQIAKIREKPGMVTVESTPGGATIYVDGQSTGVITPADLALPPGDHVISVEPEGYSAAQQSVTVLIGSKQRLNLAPLSKVKEETALSPPPKVELQAEVGSSHGRVPIWIAAGVSAAGLVTGGVLGAVALKTKGEFDAHPTEGKANKGEREALFADVGFGIAAAAGITAIVLYATDKNKQKKDPKWSVKPSVSKYNLGLAGKLSF